MRWLEPQCARHTRSVEVAELGACPRKDYRSAWGAPMSRPVSTLDWKILSEALLGGLPAGVQNGADDGPGVLPRPGPGAAALLGRHRRRSAHQPASRPAALRTRSSSRALTQGDSSAHPTRTDNPFGDTLLVLRPQPISYVGRIVARATAWKVRLNPT